jgi:hypothetical protein
VPGSTKGQVQIMEVVVVLIVFFMLIGFGMLFFTGFLREKTTQEVAYTESLELAERAKIVSSLSELHCSLRGDEQYACIDMYRAEAFANQIREPENRRHYAEIFSGYRARITCIYPEDCVERLNGVTLFDYTAKKNQGAVVPFVLPIIINDPVERKNYYGELTLEQVS